MVQDGGKAPLVLHSSVPRLSVYSALPRDILRPLEEPGGTSNKQSCKAGRSGGRATGKREGERETGINKMAHVRGRWGTGK